jgi:hypothetical protein
VCRGRVGSPSASGHDPPEGGDGNNEHSHKLATAADGGRAHGGGRCWTYSHDLLICDCARGETVGERRELYSQVEGRFSRQPRSLIRAIPG